MAIQSASAAKAASDGANIQAREVIDSLIMTIIDNAITTASTKESDDFRSYKITLYLDGDVNGRTKPVEIIQADSTRILTDDLEAALIDAGYRVYYEGIKTRDGKPDKVKLQVAWG